MDENTIKELWSIYAKIERLIDHASEVYPHFEDIRGQEDIKAAKEALISIENLILALE